MQLDEIYNFRDSFRFKSIDIQIDIQMINSLKNINLNDDSGITKEQSLLIKNYLDGIHSILKQNRWVYEKALLEIDNLNVIFPYRAKVSEDIS